MFSGQLFFHRGSKELHFCILKHHAYLLRQIHSARFLCIQSVYCNASLHFSLKEARNDPVYTLQKRGFAAAAATHKHHKLALINFQGDVLQRFALRAVIAEEKMIKNQCHIAPCS